jgi:hypothetical protein
MHQLMGVSFFWFLFVRKNLICSSDATKLGERVELDCNGKELRAAPRQKPRTCTGAACSVHCAFIGFKFVARNHLLASLLLSAGRREGCRRAGASAGEPTSGRKKRVVRGAMHFLRTAPPRFASGSASCRASWRPQGGRNSDPQNSNGVALCIDNGAHRFMSLYLYMYMIWAQVFKQMGDGGAGVFR